MGVDVSFVVGVNAVFTVSRFAGEKLEVSSGWISLTLDSDAIAWCESVSITVS